MHPSDVGHLALDSLYLALLVSAPVLLAVAAVAILVGLLQSMTQIHDVTVGFVPKLLAAAAALALAGRWMSVEVVQFTADLWRSIPAMTP